ncbi:hypothetical protein GQ607_011336, partial [Colletotrichum asianum]
PTHCLACLRPDLRPPPGLVDSDTGLGAASPAKAHVYPDWYRTPQLPPHYCTAPRTSPTDDTGQGRT